MGYLKIIKKRFAPIIAIADIGVERFNWLRGWQEGVVINGDGRVGSADVLKMNNLASVSDAEFITIRDKMLLAIQKRFSVQTGDSLYDAALDLNSNGQIDASDQTIARDAMNAIHPINLP